MLLAAGHATAKGDLEAFAIRRPDRAAAQPGLVTAVRAPKPPLSREGG